MDVVLPALLVLVALAAWVYLPLAPAVRELADRSDVEPVRVVQDSAVDVQYFARRFRRFVDEHLGAALARCREDGTPQHGQLPEGIPFVVVDHWEAKEPPAGVVACPRTLELPARGVFRFEVYAAGSVVGGDSGVYKALLAEDRVVLAPQSLSLRWLHAGATVRVGRGSRLHGRVSAGEAIELADGCAFERLNAPRIVFGREVQVDLPAIAEVPIAPADVPGVVDTEAGRWLVIGALRLPVAARVDSDIVATGDARVGRGARLVGSVKSHRDIYLGRGVRVDGSVVAGRNVHLSEGCEIHGPVLAEGMLVAAAGCRFGSPATPTTVSARRVRLGEGVVAHGTVWAHDEGVVGARTMPDTHAEPGPTAATGGDRQTGPQAEGAAEPWLREEFDRLRYRGHRGGFIPRHRALLFSPLDAPKLLQAVLLATATLVTWYLALGWVMRFWAAAIDVCAAVLGIGGVVGQVPYALFGVLPFTVPDVFVPAALPTAFEWWVGATVTLVIVVVSFLLPPHHLPTAYLLRILALFQGCSQVFFAFWPQWFPYTASGYVHTVLIASLGLITIVPLVLALTYYVFDFGPARNVALTLLTMGHLTVLVPLQYTVHAWVLHHTSLLYLPVLFLGTGLAVGVLVFIAFYSWAFSWRHQLREHRVQWKIRRRLV